MQRDELNKLVFNQNRSLQRAWKLCYKQSGDGMSMAQLGLLFHIKQLQPVSGKAIADHMQISRSAVTQLLDGLQEKGLVERREDAKDRRVTYLSIAPKGEEYFHHLEEKGMAFMEGITEALTTQELLSLTQIQAKMLADIDVRLAEI